MYRDPIVEEVRKYREANAARFGFDVRKIAEDALRRQANCGHRVVDFSGESLDQRRKQAKHRARFRKGKASARLRVTARQEGGERPRTRATVMTTSTR